MEIQAEGVCSARPVRFYHQMWHRWLWQCFWVMTREAPSLLSWASWDLNTGHAAFCHPWEVQGLELGQWNWGFACPPPLHSGCLLFYSWAPPESCKKSHHGETHVLLDSCSQRKTRIPPIVQQWWTRACQGWWQVDDNYRDQQVKVSVTWLGQTLGDPVDCSPPGSSVHGDSPGKNTGEGCHFLLQEIFPTQGLNPFSHIAGGFFTAGATREANTKKEPTPTGTNTKKENPTRKSWNLDSLHLEGSSVSLSPRAWTSHLSPWPSNSTPYGRC